jgi:cytosine/adenosine deaminase-related metal-dependent hydrolase
MRLLLRGGHVLTTTSREVLEFATIEGARVCGLEDRTGSLTPGNHADVVVLRCDHSNTYPIIDPVSTVVHQADTTIQPHWIQSAGQPAHAH